MHIRDGGAVERKKERDVRYSLICLTRRVFGGGGGGYG